jgi:ribosomal protein S7
MARFSKPQYETLSAALRAARAVESVSVSEQRGINHAERYIVAALIADQPLRFDAERFARDSGMRA